MGCCKKHGFLQKLNRFLMKINFQQNLL
jgi:hypothetical protein